MKKFFSFLLSLAFAGSTFAQMSGYSSSNYSDGTTLGANETLTADGIALGNAVKLRGHIDFLFKYNDEKGVTGADNDAQDEEFAGSVDLDFLLDFSPVTAEIHLAAASQALAFDGDESNVSNSEVEGGVAIEQAFGRYSFSDDLYVTFGRQLTALGYESDEANGLHAITDAYVLGGISNSMILSDSDEIDVLGIQTRRNYRDGVRLNYNNGMFGLIFGLHDGYWKSDDFNGDNIAIDLAASVMFFPGLEARIGYAHESVDDLDTGTGHDGDIDQFNMWLEWNPGALTLATEFDNYGIDFGPGDNTKDYWSWMLLANYQFTDWFAGTLRYTHEDVEIGTSDYESDRLTFAVLFAITNNLNLNVEYSTASVDSPAGSEPGDYNEFLVQSLINF
jgi:hypothetical protein